MSDCCDDGFVVSEVIELVVDLDGSNMTPCDDSKIAIVQSTEVRVDMVAANGPKYTFPFSFGDASPLTLMNSSVGMMVLESTIYIENEFDGVGASLSLGDSGDSGRLVASSMVQPSVHAAYMNAPIFRYGTITPITLTIVPGAGATSGKGVVSILME
jgi:hypothetical protein